MSLETNKFNVVKKKRLEGAQFNVECNIVADAHVDKVLSVCHTAEAESAEVLNGVVNFGGTIDLCVLYLTSDGEVGTTNCSCPFSSKFEDGDIIVGDKIAIKVDVEEYQVISVDGENIRINCLCAQTGTLILNRDVACVKVNDESICVNEEEMFIETFVGEAKECFSVESNVSIREPIKKVVFTDCQATIKSVESGINFVSVSGEVISRILYLTEQDRFETCYTAEPFKEEIELEGATRESLSEAKVWVKKNSVKCEIEQLERGVALKIFTPIEIKAMSYQEQNQMVIKDIYSITNELEITTESFDMTKQLSSDFFEAKIDGTLSLDEDSLRVDKILFVGGTNLTSTNAYLKNGEIFVEGVAKTNVAYLNDETSSVNSVIVEVPFVVSDKSSVNCEMAEIDVDIHLVDVDVVVKKGREFYFDAKVKVKATYACNEICAVISQINIAGEHEEKDCAIEMVYAIEGQSAWDLAKELKVKEEMIYLQNPEIKFPLEKDENIVVYYQKR